MDLGIADRQALVMGGSSGLGYAIATALKTEGCRVAISARRADRLAEAASTIGGDTAAFACDLAQQAARRGLPGRVLEERGPIDILILNGGGPPSGLFEAHSDVAWASALDEHLGAAIDLVRAVLPGMKERRWGRIVAITSCFAKQPGDGMMLSNTARVAVIAFIRTLSNEVASFGITANSLLPGYTWTRRIDSLSAQVAARDGVEPSDVVGRWTAQIPAARLGEPEELAATAAFLCSRQAAYVTGTALAVDGGWNRGLF